MRDRYSGNDHGHDRHRVEIERGCHDHGGAAARSADAALACMDGLAIRRRVAICRDSLIRRGSVVFNHIAIVMMALHLGHCGRRAMMSRPTGHGMDSVALQRQCHCKHPRQHHTQDFAHHLSLDQSAGQSADQFPRFVFMRRSEPSSRARRSSSSTSARVRPPPAASNSGA